MTFASVLPWLTSGRLAACSVLALAALLHSGTRGCFLLLLRRTRVLLLALVVLYGFGTPGLALSPEWPISELSSEGLQQGALQAWRLLLMLASLAILLTHLGRARLIAGMYVLLFPLKAFGLPIDRFALRLALALEMTASLPPQRLSPEGLAAALSSGHPASPASIEFDLPRLTGWDALFVLVSLPLLGWLLW